MRLYMAAARWLSLLLVPMTVSALGLGEIAVKSSLNEPFSAEIPLESLESTKLSELTVQLASPETFRRYGLDRPAFLGNFRFTVDEASGGKPVINVLSTQPVSEPFVTLLVDVRWPSGRLLREYTALLDPPLFEDTKVAAPVKAPEKAPESRPSAAAAGSVARPIAPSPSAPVVEEDVVAPTGLFQQPRDNQSAPTSSTRATAAPDQPQPTRAQSPVTSDTSAAVPAAADSYTARKGDTLWGISQRMRGNTGLDTNQMMLALYRANPEAFMGNINALKAGAILRIPPTDAANVLSSSEAGAEVRQQNSAWSGARASATPAARLQLVAPSTGDAAGTAGSAESASDAASSSVSGGNAGELQSRINVLEQELDESKRLLSVKDSELQRLQQRIADMEKSGAVDAGGLSAGESAIEPEPVAGAPASGDESGVDTSAMQDESPVAETTAPESDAPMQTPDAAGPAEDASPVADAAVAADADTGSAPEASGGLLGNMWLWIGAAGTLLLLGFFVIRQRKSAASASSSERWSAQREEVDHGDTLKDFTDLPSNQDSIVVEEAAFTSTDVPDESTGTGIFDAAPEPSFPDTADAFATDRFGFDDVQEVAADLGRQEAVGQDEVELPLEKTISTGAPLNLDQADPVAEAEFHMAYGLYDQAADLLARALKDDPDNHAYRLKLIEVFFVWENKEGFLEQARILQAEGSGRSDSDWNKVVILGKQLCPSDPLFTGASRSPVAGAMDLDISDAGETSIDFSVDPGDSGALDISFDPSGGDGDLDLDLGDSFGSPADDAGGAVGRSRQSGDRAGRNPDDDSSTLDFDLGESDDAATMESPTLDVMGSGSPTVAVDFDLDGGETMESPTLASPANEPTVESPTLDVMNAGAETSEMPSIDRSGGNDRFHTESPMDPTGLDIDLSGLADLPLDGSELDLDFGANDPEADSSSPLFADDEKRMSPETENILIGGEDAALFASLEQLGKVAGDTDDSSANQVSSDTVQQPQFEDDASDTAEQPAIAEPGDALDDFSAFDLSDEPKFADDATMTEVGTKLDLARAYIDMGDPDGARSILEEVLDEGGEAQQQQARQLLNELND